MAQIGDNTGVTKQRVAQIYNEAIREDTTLPERRSKQLPIEERSESAQWLLQCRSNLGVTQKELALYIGVSQSSMRNWELKGLPTIGTAAEMVKTKLEALIGGKTKNKHKFIIDKIGRVRTRT